MPAKISTIMWDKKTTTATIGAANQGSIPAVPTLRRIVAKVDERMALIRELTASP